jgi:serine carboxypeptidase-like clade 1
MNEYTGDTDPAITSFAAQNWTSHLDFVETEAWRPWTVDGCRRMGGYVTRYEGDFDFLTIRGAGHMVPAYKPKATFTFLKAWLEGKDYPVYDAKCEFPDAGHHDKAEWRKPRTQ